MTELSLSLYADLRSAFEAESAAALRYTYFAEIAEIEGYPEITKLFDDLSESVRCAAHGHLDFLQSLGDPGAGGQTGGTTSNLAAAAAGTLAQSTEIYPRLTKLAHAEGHADVASWLQAMRALKNAHLGRVNAALSSIEGAPAHASGND